MGVKEARVTANQTPSAAAASMHVHLGLDILAHATLATPGKATLMALAYVKVGGCNAGMTESVQQCFEREDSYT